MTMDLKIGRAEFTMPTLTQNPVQLVDVYRKALEEIARGDSAESPLSIARKALEQK